MSAFMHSAVSFGTPDMPPSGLGSTIGPISLHNAIVWSSGCRRSTAKACGLPATGAANSSDSPCEVPVATSMCIPGGRYGGRYDHVANGRASLFETPGVTGRRQTPKGEKPVAR